MRRSRRVRLKVFIGIAGVLAVASCGLTDTGCDADLRIQLTPTSISLDAGQSFTPTVRLFGCGGTKELTDTITWTVTDPLVLQVDAVTGRVFALKSGLAEVRPMGEKYGPVGQVVVTVR